MLSRTLIALLAVTAIGAVTAGAAAATPWEWYSYVHSPEWQQGGSPLNLAASAKLKGTVTVQDENASTLGDPKVECEISGEASVGPESAGTETHATFSKCAAVYGTCKSAELSAVHLPWHSELTSAGNVITEDGAGAPGYELTCVLLGTKVKDVCTAPTLSTSTENVSGGVSTTFDGEKLKCSIGGAHEGNLKGTVLFEAAEGAKLNTGANARQFKAITSSYSVTPSGNLKLVDKKFTLSCKISTSTSIETGGRGTISGFECKEPQWTGECGTSSASTVRMPWSTELDQLAPDEVSDKISGSGGKAGLEITCKNGGGHPFFCELASPHVSNIETSGNVVLEFASSVKASCEDDQNSGEAYWEGALTIVHPESLPALMAGGGL